jgi:hypothetical protein
VGLDSQEIGTAIGRAQQYGADRIKALKNTAINYHQMGNNIYHKTSAG